VDKWFAVVGVFGYIGLLIGYILAVTYLSPEKRRLFHGLFASMSIFILGGVLLQSVGIITDVHFVESVLSSMGITAVLMLGLYLYLRQRRKSPEKPFQPIVSRPSLSGRPDRTPVQPTEIPEPEEGQPFLDSSSLENIFRKGFSVLLYGPTGSGKTYGVIFEHLGKLEKRGERDGIVLIPCSDGMEDYDLLSKPMPVGPRDKVRILLELEKEFPDLDQSALSRIMGDWTRVEGPLREVFRRAQKGERLGVVFDELNRASRSARNLILKAMDPVMGHYELHDFTSGEVLRVPLERIQFCATCNLGASYSQTHDLDESLLDRFQSVLFVDYNTGLEERILEGEGLPPSRVSQLMSVAGALRDAYRMGHLNAPLSTRHLKNWGRAVAGGGDPQATARMLWVDRLIAHDRHGYPDEEQVMGVLEILSSTFSGTSGVPEDPASRLSQGE
jgi:MoxR-like ATPase